MKEHDKVIENCNSRTQIRKESLKFLDQPEGVVTYDTIQLIHPRSMLLNGAPLKASLFSPAQIKLDSFDK